MSKRQPNLLIEDIIDSSIKILEYTKGMSFENFTGDSKTIDAVIRNFEILKLLVKLLTVYQKNLKKNMQA